MRSIRSIAGSTQHSQQYRKCIATQLLHRKQFSYLFPALSRQRHHVARGTFRIAQLLPWFVIGCPNCWSGHVTCPDRWIGCRQPEVVRVFPMRRRKNETDFFRVVTIVLIIRKHRAFWVKIIVSCFDYRQEYSSVNSGRSVGVCPTEVVVVLWMVRIAIALFFSLCN